MFLFLQFAGQHLGTRRLFAEQHFAQFVLLDKGTAAVQLGRRSLHQLDEHIACPIDAQPGFKLREKNNLIACQIFDSQPVTTSPDKCCSS